MTWTDRDAEAGLTETVRTMDERPRVGIGGARRSSLVLWAAGLLTFVAVLSSVVWIAMSTRLMIRNLYYELPSAPPNEGITLQELEHAPWKFDGLSVTVSGEVLEFVDPHALVIGNRRIFSGEHALLVSYPPLSTLANEQIRDEDVVRVTGTVERFDPVQVELDYGIEFEHPARLLAYEGELAIVIEDIEVNPPVTKEGQKRNPANSSGAEFGVTAQDVAFDTEEYVGRRVEVSAEIEQRLSPEVFILSDHQILVVAREPLTQVTEEATAYVIGEVRVFDRSDLEEELGISLNGDLFRAYEGFPAIILEGLRVVR